VEIDQPRLAQRRLETKRCRGGGATARARTQTPVLRSLPTGPARAGVHDRAITFRVQGRSTPSPGQRLPELRKALVSSAVRTSSKVRSSASESNRARSPLPSASASSSSAGGGADAG